MWWAVIGMSGVRRGGLEGFGSYERGLLTEYGWIEGIKVPRVRGISWTSSVWRRYQRRQKALDRVILEGFLLGHSTRKTTKIFKRVFKGLISARCVCIKREESRGEGRESGSDSA